VGAVGREPNCFNQTILSALLKANPNKRPVVFALSNPMTKAEVTAADAYRWTDGRVIYGSGTAMPDVEVKGKRRHPGQVNNVYIFPGVSFGVICCQASTIPERFFLAAAQGVANSLDETDLSHDAVVRLFFWLEWHLYLSSTTGLHHPRTLLLSCGTGRDKLAG
jgi:malate dehydrogenase (oxaloacetate-decarboxylating)(NADP+)